MFLLVLVSLFGIIEFVLGHGKNCVELYEISYKIKLIVTNRHSTSQKRAHNVNEVW